MKKQWDVVLFLDNIMLRKSLPDIMENLEQNFIKKEYFGGVVDLAFPFFEEGSKLIMNQGINQKLEVRLGEELIGYYNIRHGDIITIYDGLTGYQILFLNYAEINLGYDIYAFEQEKEITIGRRQENSISMEDNIYLSKNSHVRIFRQENDEIYAEESAKKKRLYINGIQTLSGKLDIGDELFLVGISILIGNGWIGVSKDRTRCNGLQPKQISYQINGNGAVKSFNITPRILHSLNRQIYKIDAPPAIAREHQQSVLLTMGPSLTMAVAMLVSFGFTISNAVGERGISSIVSSLSMTVGMMTGAILWPILRKHYQKKYDSKMEELRRDRYYSYIERKRRELHQAYFYNWEIYARELAPQPKFICHFLDEKGGKTPYQHRLWERSKEDWDFLNVRLGTGTVENPVEILIPEEKFELYSDELSEEPRRLYYAYSDIKKAAITISLLTYRSVGVVAETKHSLYDMGRQILLNIAALHSGKEVKIAVIYDPKQEKQYTWLKKMPHIWSDDHQIRLLASNPIETRNVFSYIEEQLSKQFQETEQQEIPYFVLIIEESEFVKQEGIFRYLKNKGSNISVIYLYGSFSKLPKDSDLLIECRKDDGTYYSKKESDGTLVSFQKDKLDEADLLYFSNKISQLSTEETKQRLSIPESVSFMELYQAGNVKELCVLDRWKRANASKTLGVPIGVMENGAVFSLDIHEKYHGCHGLVAGMTGSGKSEFLQAYILSLMVNFSPEEISFVLIDYKGGDMLRPFLQTPHMAASLDNMSENMLYRALVSLKAENERRQKLLTEAKELLQVDKLDINSYQKYYKDGRLKKTLPHLVIIVDEFAELKAQHWEFLEQLVNVARIGRSLGVHLILATQRPSGQVDPQIWSNSRFHICLKVQTRVDSNEMIGRGDAAFIRRPGEFYAMIGYEELYIQAQSAYSGAEYIESENFVTADASTVILADHTAAPRRAITDNIAGKKTGKQQISVIVQHIIHEAEGIYDPVVSLWKPVLQVKLYVDDIVSDMSQSQKQGVFLTVLDDIKNQSQPTYLFDFRKQGNTAIYGLSESGKTTMIQTLLTGMAYRYTPEQWCFYYLDMAGGSIGYYQYLPHCGGLVKGDQEQQISAAIGLFQEEIEHRKQLFSENNCGSYGEYKKIADEPLPIITIVIDLYAPFLERYFRLQSKLIDIISTGKTYGIYMVITSNSKNGIHYKVKEQITTCFTLYMNDKVTHQILLGTSHIPVIPEDIPGRGIMLIGDGKEKRAVEFQTLLYEKAQSESVRIERLIQKYKKIKQSWSGKLPQPISNGQVVKSDEKASKNSIHEAAADKDKISYAQSEVTSPPAIEQSEGYLKLGENLSRTKQYGISLKHAVTLSVTGEQEMEQITCMRVILSEISHLTNAKIFLFDPEKQLQKENKEGAQITLINSREEIEKCMKVLGRDFNSRMDQKEKLDQKNRNSDNIYETFQNETRYFVLINGFSSFFEIASNKAVEAFTIILQNCSLIGIYFIVSEKYSKLNRYRGLKIYNLLFQSSHGVICDGEITIKSAIYLSPKLMRIKAGLKEWRKESGQWLFYSGEKAVVIIQCQE